MSLPVDVVLVVLGYDAKGLFALALPAASAPWLVLPHAALNDGVHPDEVARTLLQQVTDTEAVPERVCFDCDGERLQLIYRVLLPSPDDPALLSDQLQEKQKESYKKGGRKAVKLYRKRTR
ncbi:hypothetical protein G8764_03425 [Pseudomaricurvus alcaniphilus]|uniref:hypothetical protein n=1 Tax=Pseudomaricurvus alcaniphilus TaxID=1166482 RepID=UPI00140E84A0|nr:hypothetical protein [Pseudomaricurvus alcaniphilus]NHN36337.1 hypothetical protein [Pseudomaricurvus alcaniphilus]